MNHGYFETRGKEKIKELQNEGLMSQAYYRHRAVKPTILKGIWGSISKFLRFVIRRPESKKDHSRIPGLKYKTQIRR